MRKAQSYQEPSTLPNPNDLKTSNVSSSHEFPRTIRLSADIDLFSLKNSQCVQPLFELKQNPNISKPLFGKPKYMQAVEKPPSDENHMIRSLNMNQAQKKSFKLIPKYTQNPVTARYSSNIGEDFHPYRPSFNQLKKNEPEDV